MELAVQTREKFGKTVKALRTQGFIPAELYGHGVENLHLTVSEKEFVKVFKEAGENTVIQLLIDSEKRPALVHDIQRDYVDDSVIHVDFYQVRMDEKLNVRVPIEFVGDAPAVKEKAGILNRSMTEIEVEALPSNLPHHFTVSLDGLTDLNQSIYVKDIEVPKDVGVLVDPETVVVTVTPPLKEEEVAPSPVDVSQVKVETEEKKAEREQEKAKEENAEGAAA